MFANELICLPFAIPLVHSKHHTRIQFLRVFKYNVYKYKYPTAAFEEFQAKLTILFRLHASGLSANKILVFAQTDLKKFEFL